MDLSNPERVVKLAKYLIMRPRYVPCYIHDNILGRRSPLELEKPWWSYSAIDAMEACINQSSRVFEWGSGGSTLFFGQRVGSVDAVESDPTWYALVKQKSEQYGANKVNLHYRPVERDHLNQFQDSDFLNALNKPYDVIVIDGIEITGNERKMCFSHAERHAIEGTIIVVDDFWRYHSLVDNHRAKRVTVYEGTGPGRLGVTSTAFFFY